MTGLAGALHAMMTGIAPLSNAEYHTSEMILVMTVIGGTGNLLARNLGIPLDEAAALEVIFTGHKDTRY